MSGVKARPRAGKAPKSKEDRRFVTALARGLEVLNCFHSGDKLLGNLDIAQRCQLPRPTVSRLTYTLTRLGYLRHIEEWGKYQLGTASLALGSAMLARMDVRQIARPRMQELADFSKGTVSLGTRDRLAMIYVENCRSKAALTLRLDVGSRIPVTTTAMGRAYLAASSGAERDTLLERIHEQDQKAWPNSLQDMEKALEDYHRLGCTCSFGEWQQDVNAIAAAFRPGGGLPPMVINCGGPACTLTREFLLIEVRPRLLELVRRLDHSERTHG